MSVPEASLVDEPSRDGGHAVDEQARDEARLRTRRGRLVAAVVAGTLVLVVVVVALLGGFADRASTFTASAPGSVVASGPFRVTLDRATVVHEVADDEWQVRVTGTIASTGDKSLVPTTGASGFLVAKASGTNETSSAEAAALGDPDAIPSRSLVSPGLPPAPWTVQFTFTHEPGPRVLVGVFEQTFTTRYIFSDEKSWQTDRDASTVELPLEQLPDEKY